MFGCSSLNAFNVTNGLNIDRTVKIKIWKEVSVNKGTFFKPKWKKEWTLRFNRDIAALDTESAPHCGFLKITAYLIPNMKELVSEKRRFSCVGKIDTTGAHDVTLKRNSKGEYYFSIS